MSLPGQQSQEFRTFRGLTPGVDRKRIEEPFCVDGKDFLVDIDGPISALSREWILTDVDEPRGWQTLENEDESDRLHFVADAICKYDATTRQFYPIFHHATRDEWWPWFRAICGGVLYLANKEIGLVSYDPITGQWSYVTGAFIPDVIFAMCASGGRLVLVSALYVHWSEIDDGTNAGFEPDVNTGAGFQGLSVLSSGTQPLRAAEYEFGFMVFTRDGIIKFEHTNTQNPFRWTILSRQHKLLNPWCMAEIVEGNSQQQVFLTERGLFSTFGSLPQPWQEIMSEYLRLRVIPTIRHNFNDMVFRFTYSKIDGWLVISIASNGQNAVFDRAVILHMNEWGSYNRAHTGFGEIAVDSGVNQGITFGVCGATGTLFIFSRTDHHRVFPDYVPGQIDYRTFFDMPAQFMGLGTEPENVSIMRSMMLFYEEPIYLLDEAGVFNVFATLTEELSPEEMPTNADYALGGAAEEIDYGFIGDSVTVEEDWGFVALAPSEFFDYQDLVELARMGCALNLQTGLFQAGVEPTPYQREALNAELTIGPIYVKQEGEIDYLSQLQTAIISMNDAGVNDVFEDYIEDYRDITTQEDWLTASGDEDWGFNAGTYNEYEIEFRGTLDAYKIWEVDGVEQIVVPEVQLKEGKNKYLAGSVTGMYLLARITTPNLGDTFHLKVARFNMTDAGRLF